jgi:hypothetical protein
MSAAYFKRWSANMLKVEAVVLLIVLHCGVATAQHIEEAPDCRSAFGLTQTHPWPPVTSYFATILPRNPTADDVIALCTVDFVYPDHVDVSLNGNRVTATVFDNGFSWSPNPVIVVKQTIGKLPAGTYTLDAFIDAEWAPKPPWYPKTLASGLVFSVADALPVPTLRAELNVLLVCVVSGLGLLSLSRRRRRHGITRPRSKP